jgi:hypothetical protein
VVVASLKWDGSGRAPAPRQRVRKRSTPDRRTAAKRPRRCLEWGQERRSRNVRGVSALPLNSDRGRCRAQMARCAQLQTYGCLNLRGEGLCQQSRPCPNVRPIRSARQWPLTN